MGDLVKGFVIGPMIWRVWGLRNFTQLPFDEWDAEMVEPWYVERITPQKVFIGSYIDPANPPGRHYTLSRSRLQSHGWAGSRQVSNEPDETPGALFIVDVPLAYRKRTIGYAIQADAKAILGLPADASDAAIRAAYLTQVKQHHPERGGDQETFMRIQRAYEGLKDRPSLDEILTFVRR